jgi:hypothetical protein
MSIRKKVEVMNTNVTDQVLHLIAKSMSEACSGIVEGAAWVPVVHIIHSLGVHSMRVPGLQAGPVERAKALNEINHQLSPLKGKLVITLRMFGLARTLQTAGRPSLGTSPFLAAARRWWRKLSNAPGAGLAAC